MSKRPGYAANWCVRYRYNRDARKPEDDTCEAGVRYDSVRGPHQPCFLDDFGESKPDDSNCAYIRRPAPEEIAAHKAWIEKRMTLQGVVMLGIKAWRKAHQKQNFAEVVECPACKGRLHLSIAASNGHVHGHCESENCVSWME